MHTTLAAWEFISEANVVAPCQMTLARTLALLPERDAQVRELSLHRPILLGPRHARKSTRMRTAHRLEQKRGAYMLQRRVG